MQPVATTFFFYLLSGLAILGGLLIYYVRQAPFAGCADCADAGRAAVHYLWTGDAGLNIILIFFTMGDVVSRNWIGVAGR